MTARGRLAVVAVLVLALPEGRAAAAAPPDGALRATLRCERRSAPGRLVCEVEAEVDAGRIAWLDVVVRGAPDFASPLRERVGLPEASLATDRRVRLPLALFAARAGRGELRVSARAVHCVGERPGESCVPITRDAAADVIVGTLVLAARAP